MSWDEIPGDLRSKYLRAAAMTVAQLLRLVGRLQYDPADLPALRVLLQRFHAIAGWGGLCGVPAFTVAGQLGEHDCASLLAASVLPEQRHLDQIGALVHLLMREIRQRQAAPEIQEQPDATPEIQEQPAATPGLQAPPAAAPVAERQARPRFRALCVGVPDAFGGQLRGMLARHGIVTQFAGTSDEAGLLLSAGMPDAVIVGRELVDGSGYVLADYLRCSEATRRQPVVLVVGGSGGAADLAEQVQCGADGAFPAPVDGAAVSACLVELLQRRDSGVPRVLCLEPDPTHALALRELLHDAGYSVRLASDPRRLARQMSAFDPELVVLDLPHPDATTGDLVRRLRAGKRCAVVPILFLTDPDEPHSATPSMLGAEYLAKPISPPAFLAAVAGRVERLRALRQLFADSAPR
jgi:DNA-binding response OmpR family regulator